MTRLIPIFFFVVLFFFSCDISKKKGEKVQMPQNQLVVTTKGDSLENGFWKYDKGVNGITSSGNYEDGYKINLWTYKTDKDSMRVNWRIVNNNGVKLNVPDYLKQFENSEMPAMFHFDIPDNDDNTYLVLLRYNLLELNLVVYDYLYQNYKAWEDISNEYLESMEFKKFTFKGIEIFRAKFTTEGKERYTTISYIFVVNNSLYDLTYKNIQSKTSLLDLEVFNDILYSMECEDFDLFNYNNRKYLKEENIVFDEGYNEG